MLALGNGGCAMKTQQDHSECLGKEVALVEKTYLQDIESVALLLVLLALGLFTNRTHSRLTIHLDRKET